MTQFSKTQNMKKRFKLIILAFALVVTSVVSIGFTDNYFEIAKNLDIFTTLYKELNTFYVDETDPGKLMKEGIDKMLKSLDPYTTYIPESDIEDFRFMTTGQYGGIGAIITKRKDYVYVSEPYEGFPRIIVIIKEKNNKINILFCIVLIIENTQVSSCFLWVFKLSLANQILTRIRFLSKSWLDL